jgi:hypothetical protein
MNHSESIKELAGALAKAQGAMGAAKMDSTNPFLKNKYADLGSVIQAAKKPLSDNGLSYTQHPAVTDSHVTVTTILMHLSGEWIESEISLPLDGGKGLSLAQSMGAIITYLRRYTLSAILGIYADEDTDGNKPAQKERSQPAPVPGTGAITEYENKIVDELIPPDAPSVVQVPVMSYEEACTVTTSDPTPKPYVEIDHATLSNMANSISKKLLKHGYTTPPEVETAERKLAAIRAILAHK